MDDIKRGTGAVLVLLLGLAISATCIITVAISNLPK